MQRLRYYLLQFLLVSCAVSCANEDPGIPPDRDIFYFPTGIALDSKRSILYVSNSNADLRYNGGTVMALQIGDLPTDLSLVADLVSKGKLDCAPDRLYPNRWECPESQFIRPQSTVRIGDFPGELRLSFEGDRLFVPVRGQNYVGWVDVAELDDSECEGSSPCVDLRCDDSPDTGCGNAGNRDCPTWDCDNDHLLNVSERRQSTLPAEPFGIFYHHLTDVEVDADGVRRAAADGCSAELSDCEGEPPLSSCCVRAPGLDHVYVAHLSGGEVSYLASRPGAVELMDFTGGFFTSTTSIRGGFSLAPMRPGDGEAPVFVSSRVDDDIATFVIQENTRIIRGSRYPVGVLEPGTDVRGIAFDPEQEVLYAINRSPSALVALDMSRREGRVAGDPLWAVEVCGEPSILRLGPPDSSGKKLAYVVCFTDKQVYVIDTDTARVVERIATGEGPNAIELDGANNRAFIANFAESTIGVIDLNPEHSTYQKMVLRIGLAKKPQTE